jgi:hypothetical protein
MKTLEFRLEYDNGKRGKMSYAMRSDLEMSMALYQ